MTLNQALALVRERRQTGPAQAHFLVCGCEPLHLATFFKAHLLERLPEQSIDVLTGLFGDLTGNLQRASESTALSAAVVVEWSDIDPRLGPRSTGRWTAGEVDTPLERIASALEKLGARMPVAVAPTTLPLPPLGNTIRAQASGVELELAAKLAAFAARIAAMPGVRVVDTARLDQVARFDARMSLMAGFPYTLAWASELAKGLAEVLYQSAPKKGLITDLDDTLWAGLAGEIGPDAVSWRQEDHAQVHGLYQQMLANLGACGVLLAACSKNEMVVAEAALARKDLFLEAGALFPVYANWGAKSASVAQILKAWNIGADAVVFIDDNAMELAEVQQAFPEIRCIQFPKNDPVKVWNLLGELRDLFGKPLVMEEDRLRQGSLRAAAAMVETSPDFLRGLEGKITIDYRKNANDKRPLELINKTNQFNLNGLRMSEGEWQRYLEAQGTVLAVVSYQDKFGPLGKIAVLTAELTGSSVKVSHWVMSCRAFSRGIERHTLESLFRQTGAESIQFAFAATERNQPLQEFFRETGVSADGRLARREFDLPHEINEVLS